MRTTMTLEKLLANTPDEDLLTIQEELFSNVVPATGYVHHFIRKVNRMIDQGKLCINPNTYRRVYLPTFAKALHKELARRYMLIMTGRHYAACTKDDGYEQMALDLVKEHEQANTKEQD